MARPPSREEFDRASSPYRISDGRVYRRAGANADSDWYVTFRQGNEEKQARISADGAYAMIQNAAINDQLAPVGRAPTEEQLRNQQRINAEYAAAQAANRSASAGSAAQPVAAAAAASSVEEQASARDRSAELRENAVFRESSTPLYDSTNPNQSFSVSRQRGDTFNISRFRSEVTSFDNLLPNHSFLVVFAPMDWVSTRAVREGIDTNLTMRCDNVVLPSISLLQEQNIRRYGFGPVENVAYGINVGDFTLQFIVDKQASIIDFFEAWMNKIVNRDSYGGANINNRLGADKTPYEVAYKDTYVCPSVNVFVYDRSQNTVLEYNIYDVFPTGIQSMNLAWAEENSFMRLNITFSFTDLRIRPKVSSFEQAAGQRAGSRYFDSQNVPPAAITAAGDRPLVEPGSIQIPADLVPPVVIGDGDDGVPRTFGTPSDTAPVNTNSPEVSPPTTRDAFGQPFTVT